MQGILRVAAAVPHLHLANVDANVTEHLNKLGEAKAKHASLVVFPELSLTGYTCGDLFFQQTLLKDVVSGLVRLRDGMPEGLIAVVGAPLRLESGLYNCAVVLSKGCIHGAVPKTYLPNNNEFYEKRWFRSGEGLPEDSVALDMPEELVGSAMFESADGVRFGVELCEDLWSPLPPSTFVALSGAEVIVNLSASNELIAKREYRQELIRQQSARCLCGYVYVSAGAGESTSDLVFSGHSMVASCGAAIRENDGYLADDYLMTADIDIDRIRADRMKQTSFGDCAQTHHQATDIVVVEQELLLPEDVTPDVYVPKHPFIPSDRASRQTRCEQIFAMQATALAQRLKITGGRVTVGISGGLDSTLALLAACKAVDLLGLPRTNILGITMPCFGTTDWTYQSALELMRTLGVEQREIPIHEAVRLHFRDIGHEESDHSVTYENAQARERTQILMDVANKTGGIVLGTGDLSEIALGWCTYNADHMSMYGVNSGVPKTLVRWVIQTAAERPEFEASKAVLQRILDTPISPELLPPDEQGNIAQQTEDLVGPYALHDFFLYYAIRFGYPPKKVFELCCMAFREDFDRATILKWLKNFYRRFWNQQFKRNCMPDGVKLGSIALSPRGDWRMPSDAQSAAWLRECEALEI
ncbi:MAG: NAD(+) synthase [Christensenellaceae bacterium]|nr:NAD(+) synthase [Christensenellaceae bacterium]